MLFKLLTAPLTLPMSGIGYVLKTLQNVAEKEIYDPQRIREDLLLLQLNLEEGKITEEEYREREGEIMVRLRAARAYNDAQAAQARDQGIEYTIEVPESDQGGRRR